MKNQVAPSVLNSYGHLDVDERKLIHSMVALSNGQTSESWFENYIAIRNVLFLQIMELRKDASIDIDKLKGICSEIERFGILHKSFSENLFTSALIVLNARDPIENINDVLRPLDEKFKPLSKHDGWAYTDMFLSGYFALLLKSSGISLRSAVYLARYIFGLSESKIEESYRQAVAYKQPEDTQVNEVISYLLLFLLFYRISLLKKDINALPPRAKNQKRSADNAATLVNQYKDILYRYGWYLADSAAHLFTANSPFVNTITNSNFQELIRNREQEKQSLYLSEECVATLALFLGIEKMDPRLLQIDLLTLTNNT